MSNRTLHKIRDQAADKKIPVGHAKHSQNHVSKGESIRSLNGRKMMQGGFNGVTKLVESGLTVGSILEYNDYRIVPTPQSTIVLNAGTDQFTDLEIRQLTGIWTARGGAILHFKYQNSAVTPFVLNDLWNIWSRVELMPNNGDTTVVINQPIQFKEIFQLFSRSFDIDGNRMHWWESGMGESWMGMPKSEDIVTDIYAKPGAITGGTNIQGVYRTSPLVIPAGGTVDFRIPLENLVPWFHEKFALGAAVHDESIAPKVRFYWRSNASLAWDAASAAIIPSLTITNIELEIRTEQPSNPAIKHAQLKTLSAGFVIGYLEPLTATLAFNTFTGDTSENYVSANAIKGKIALRNIYLTSSNRFGNVVGRYQETDAISKVTFRDSAGTVESYTDRDITLFNESMLANQTNQEVKNFMFQYHMNGNYAHLQAANEATGGAYIVASGAQTAALIRYDTRIKRAIFDWTTNSVVDDFHHSTRSETARDSDGLDTIAFIPGNAMSGTTIEQDQGQAVGTPVPKILFLSCYRYTTFNYSKGGLTLHREGYDHK